jgi:hypothetical protein
MQPTVAVRDSWLAGERAYCILANGGIPDGQANGEDRFWITVDGESPLP